MNILYFYMDDRELILCRMIYGWLGIKLLLKIKPGRANDHINLFHPFSNRVGFLS